MDLMAGGKLKDTVRKNLVRLRESQGLTQAQLEAKAGNEMVGAIEAGHRNPSLATLEELADALGVDVSEFFSGHDRGYTPELQEFLLTDLGRTATNEEIDCLMRLKTAAASPTVTTYAIALAALRTRDKIAPI